MKFSTIIITSLASGKKTQHMWILVWSNIRLWTNYSELLDIFMKYTAAAKLTGIIWNKLFPYTEKISYTIFITDLDYMYTFVFFWA